MVVRQPRMTYSVTYRREHSLIKRLICIPCLILLSFLPAIAEEPLRTIDGIVSEVSDGDTITVVNSQGKMVKLRLYMVDAPEKEKSNQKAGRMNKPGQSYGDEAWKALSAKIYRKRVKAEVMAVHKNRAISVVWLDGRNINIEMVVEGWAWCRRCQDQPQAAEYVQAEKDARSRRLGLWQQSAPQPPWEFRKMVVKRSILKALSFKLFE